jgi:Zn-dependent peptidase ImmA (M78 family)
MIKYLSKQRKEELSNLAEFIADKYCFDNLVNPEIIAKKNNITFSYGNYEDFFDGLIEYFEKRFHIYINIDRLKHSHTLRSRFTFAHELGHFFIDEHRNALSTGSAPAHSSFTNFSSENYVEWEADYFASSLLLPKSRFQKDCFKKKFSFLLLDTLSKKYQTSLTSTAIKFADIGNHPILIIFGENNKVKWQWNSEDFPFKNLLHDKYKIPENTVIGEYFNLGKNIKKTQPVWAMDWFRNTSKNDSVRQFYEHCIPYQNQALSIIWED